MDTEAKSVVIKPNTPRIPPASLGAPRRAQPLLPTGRSATTPAKAGDEGAASPPKSNVPTWRFAKLWGVAEILRFKDGTTYTFPLIRRNSQSGYSPTSSAFITDETLAKNLREEMKKNQSIREVVSQQ